MSNCSVIGKGAEIAVVGEKSTALLHTLTFDNQPCKDLLSSITCEVQSAVVGIRERGYVRRKGQSHYEISYQPTVKGRHIKIDGQHITGSPLAVFVISPVATFSTPILTFDDQLE